MTDAALPSQATAGTPPEADAGASASERLARWRVRYWSIFAGQTVSLVGSALTQFVLLWWVTDTTGSVSAVALTGVVGLLPQALLGPLGGTFADRYSRRVLMIAADVISAACMAVLMVLFLTHAVHLWHVYTMMFVRSAMQAFQTPAATASTTMLVPPDFLPRASGLNQTLQGIIAVAAAPLGALALYLMPLGWALGIDVITAAVGISPLFFYRIPQPDGPASKDQGLWAEFKDGVGVVWNNRVLLRLYCMLAATIFVVMPCLSLLPLLVKQAFGLGVRQVAVAESCGGAGMIVGGLLIAYFSPKKLVLWVLCGFATSCALIAVMALSPRGLFSVAVACWSVSGVLYILGNAPFMSLVQIVVPHDLQGRALSILNTLTGVAAPIGLAVATPIGHWIGIRWLYLLLGVCGTLVCLAGFMSPVLRRATDKDVETEEAELE